MATLAQAVAAPRARGRSRTAYRIGAVAAGSLVVAALAQVSIPLGFTPVPITGQTLGVLLVGAALGPGLGALALALYLAEGAVGLPFFAHHAHGISALGLASATGGYLWGFVVAAALVGLLAERGWDRSFASALGAMFLGNLVIYGFGVAWLMHALRLPLPAGLQDGLYPFVVGDALKVVVAGAALPAAWRLAGRR